MLKIKRIYEEYSEDDGYRILVDRLWPRGVSKERANLDLWAKDITPSKELREEYHHGLENFEDFAFKYNIELENNKYGAEFIELIKEKLKDDNVVLLYASKNEDLNHAVVLKHWLEEKIPNNI